jgi:pimeloyl-ACP methyl ester carboxylesterase
VRRRRPVYPPVPPQEMPPARTVLVPGRGEFFVRDTGLSPAGPAGPTDAPAVLLLHGWTVTADLNWCGAYDALAEAGYRVLALDHRGHGRGLRAQEPFRLADCAADAAAVLRRLQVAPAIVAGYSMGGAIAQLMARDHRDVISGLVLSGTCQHFQDDETRKLWKWMGAFGLALGVAPRPLYTAAFKRSGIELNERTAWWLSELMRHQSRDVAEAGRELGRFDSRPWLGSVTGIPTATALTSADQAVSPAKQRELAAALGSSIFEAPIDHLEVSVKTADYNPALLAAIQDVHARQAVPVAS